MSNTPHDVAIALAGEFKTAHPDLNEADTRHRFIDVVLHQVLGWPLGAMRNEVHCREGFVDYTLVRSDETPVLLIEAKREGRYFSAPPPPQPNNNASFTKVKTLITDKTIKDVIEQVRNYCIDIGVPFAAITNGHQWIFFRTFQQGCAWDELRALVIHSLDYFSQQYTEAIGYLGYSEVMFKGSLNQLLGDSPLYNRELYSPKDQISSYRAPTAKNQYAQYLRPIVDKFFGTIDPNDTDFIESCYVRDSEARVAFSHAMARLEDAVTPFLRQYGIQDFENNDSGGAFARRLGKSIAKNTNADVVVLFGGKGVGKSTFLRTLLYHSPPQIIRKNSVISLIDLLTTPEKNKEAVYDTIWSSLVDDLDSDRLLQSSRDSLQILFEDRFEVALKQDLYGYAKNTDRYNEKLNELVRDWKKDKKYCAQRLAAYWAKKHKAVIVVLDNTDQYSRELQEFCFTTAQEIANLLGCLTIVSMREERFHASSIHGTLDAYQNSGFHISSPSPEQVFLRRVRYVLKLLTDPQSQSKLIPPGTKDDAINRCIRLFRIFESEFGNVDSHLSGFLGACAHGNIRLALDLFRGITTSGYTNVHEMTTPSNWTIQIHQVIKPVMIPTRFFYEETQSAIPNIYQIRAKRFGSHFSALRILTLLAQGAESNNAPFLPVGAILSDFSDTFGMVEDCRENIDLLLKYKLIEADNRLDEFSEDLDNVRMTPYGLYIYKDLSRTFNYMDLVSCDCPVSDQQVSNELAYYSNSEYSLWMQGLRVARLEARINRAGKFIQYLENEERREIEIFSIQDRPSYASIMRSRFTEETEMALRSARRQRN